MTVDIRTIVFIDDDEIIGLVSKRLLEHLKAAREIAVFSDSLLGLAHLENRYHPASSYVLEPGIDLVFLDLDMPGLGGTAILDKLMALKDLKKLVLDSTYFVIVSSHLGEKEAGLTTTYPLLGLLEKPLRPQQVQDLLSKIPKHTPL